MMQGRDTIRELESQIDGILSESSLYAELSAEEKQGLIAYLRKYFVADFEALPFDRRLNPPSRPGSESVKRRP